MCVILVKLGKKTVKYDTLEKVWDANNDGAGFMYVKEGKIQIRKGYFKFKQFTKDYYEAVGETENGLIILHFRVATQGRVDVQNCHPHRINRSWAFVHNGIFTMTSGTNKEFSDTMLFNSLVLKRLPEGWMNNPGVVRLIRYAIGASKVVFLHKGGKVYIVNEKMGVWEDGIWYSNTFWRSVVYSYKGGTKRAWRGGEVERDVEDRVGIGEEKVGFCGAGAGVGKTVAESSDRINPMKIIDGILLGKEDKVEGGVKEKEVELVEDWLYDSTLELLVNTLTGETKVPTEVEKVRAGRATKLLTGQAALPAGPSVASMERAFNSPVFGGLGMNAEMEYD